TWLNPLILTEQQCMRFSHRAREFKSRNCLFASDRREAFEELIERIPGFEVVEERLDRHARPDEHRGPAENLGMAVHDSRSVGHDQTTVYRLRNKDWARTGVATAAHPIGGRDAGDERQEAVDATGHH